MYLKVSRTIISLVILLLFLEILGVAATALPSASDDTLTLHSHKPLSSILGYFLFEKVEEETENTGDEENSMAGVFLLDFSRIAFSLSFYHTPQVQFTVLAFQYDVRPPLHEFNCVFLI
jgi:hypothetical protein